MEIRKFTIATFTGQKFTSLNDKASLELPGSAIQGKNTLKGGRERWVCMREGIESHALTPTQSVYYTMKSDILSSHRLLIL